MERYLILKLESLLSSWGDPTYEDYRPTLPFPTKSAVLGLLGACLGIRRDDPESLLDLKSSLAYAVRQDKTDTRPTLIVDYQITEGVKQANYGARKHPVVSHREYWADAKYTVALRFYTDPAYDMNAIHHAIHNPIFTPYLGRKSCVPTRPLWATEEETGSKDGTVKAKSFLHALSMVSPHDGTVYSEEKESNTVLSVRDNPYHSRKRRRFDTREVFVHGEARQ